LSMSDLSTGPRFVICSTLKSTSRNYDCEFLDYCYCSLTSYVYVDVTLTLSTIHDLDSELTSRHWRSSFASSSVDKSSYKSSSLGMNVISASLIEEDMRC
jgi:hypothetical protein